MPVFAASFPRTFISLYCATERVSTPHRAGRVRAQREQAIEVELHCRKCGVKVVYTMNKLPADYYAYQVRVVGEDNPALPAWARPQPLSHLEEELVVLAISSQHAHEQAEAVHQMPFRGHCVTYYVNGVAHPDERF